VKTIGSCICRSGTVPCASRACALPRAQSSVPRWWFPLRSTDTRTGRDPPGVRRCPCGFRSTAALQASAHVYRPISAHHAALRPAALRCSRRSASSASSRAQDLWRGSTAHRVMRLTTRAWSHLHVVHDDIRVAIGDEVADAALILCFRAHHNHCVTRLNVISTGVC